MKFCNFGIKQRHCGRLFYFGPDLRWHYIFENNLVRQIKEEDPKYFADLVACNLIKLI